MELAFQEYGEGRPVIILHGLFGQSKNWNAIAKQMGRSFHIFTLDLRNHGESPSSETMSYPEMAEDVAEFIQNQTLDQADVVGHSMGGKVAMTLALKRPELVRSLCVADIAPVKYSHSFKSYVDVLKSVDLHSLKSRKDIDGQIADVVKSPAVRAFLLTNLAHSESGFYWQVNLEALGNEMDTISGVPTIRPDSRYDGPTLFLNGGASDYVQRSHSQLIRHLFPKVSFETIEGAGHWLHAEKPHDFMKILSDFLEAIKGE